MEVQPGAFVTIAEFMLPTDVAVARGRLESEGIECRLMDELTVQVHNLYSQAVGGVKLQVRAEDADRAKAFLAEWGLYTEGEPESSALWMEIDAITRRIPFLGRIELLMARLMVLLALVLLIVLVPIAISAQPSRTDLLLRGNWCMDGVVHDGIPLEPRTLTTGLLWLDGCTEEIRFDRNGTVRMPGFNSTAIHGQWAIEGGRLHFLRMDTLSEVFDGPFQVAVDERELTLRSERTSIYCTHVVYGF